MSTSNTEYAKQYYQRNKAKILLQQKARQEANPEAKKAAQRKYSAKHLETNPEACREARLKWQLTLKGSGEPPGACSLANSGSENQIAILDCCRPLPFKRSLCLQKSCLATDDK